MAILQALSKLEQQHHLLFFDAGCHLKLRGKARLSEYF